MLNNKDNIIIPLDNSYSARVNWYILFGWIMLPNVEDRRNDVISYIYNKYLLSKGRMPSKEFAPDYYNEYYMFMAFAEDYRNGIRYLINKRQRSVLAAGCVIACLYSMVNIEIKDHGLNKARKVCLKTRSHQLKQWKFNNTNYLIKVESKNRDIFPYCAAYYDFHHNKILRTTTTQSGLEKFLKIVLLYQDFCNEYIRSRSHDGIDPYIIRPRRIIEVDKEFKFTNKEPVLSQVFSKEEICAALNGDPTG